MMDKETKEKLLLTHIVNLAPKTSSDNSMFTIRSNGEMEEDTGPLEFDFDSYLQEEYKVMNETKIGNLNDDYDIATLKLLQSIFVTSVDPQDNHIVYTDIEDLLCKITEDPKFSKILHNIFEEETNGFILEDVKDCLSGNFSEETYIRFCDLIHKARVALG